LTDFRKILKFNENLFSGTRFVPCRQMDGRTDRETARHNEANSHLSLVCQTPKKLDDKKKFKTECR